MMNQHMKGCPVSLITREIQTNTTMRYYIIITRMDVISKSGAKCWQRYGVMGNILRYKLNVSPQKLHIEALVSSCVSIRWGTLRKYLRLNEFIDWASEPIEIMSL
jgi:predicted AAA+ superfamily ATPase